MQKISRLILRLFGWKVILSCEEPPKSIVCVAPHTSNWDFIVGKLSYWAVNRQSSFLIKKSWFIFPLNYIFNSMGGIPIDRKKASSVTDQMALEFNKREKFHLAITPEGTRSFTKRWKMGFYNIALKANIPIELAYIDYKKKEMGVKEVFIPTGDEKADMKHIKSYYKDVEGRFPENFNKDF